MILKDNLSQSQCHYCRPRIFEVLVAADAAVYDARCLDPVAEPPLADEATKLTSTKGITHVIDIRGPVITTSKQSFGEASPAGFQGLERQRRGTTYK